MEKSTSLRETATGHGPKRQVWALAGFGLAGFLLLQLLNSALPTYADDQVYAKLAWNFASGNGIHGPYSAEWFREYARYPLFPSLSMTPFAWIMHHFLPQADPASPSLPAWAWFFLRAHGSLCGALCMVLTWMWMRSLGTSARWATFSALLLVFGTPVWTYYRELFSEGVQTTLVLVCPLIAYRIGIRQSREGNFLSLPRVILCLSLTAAVNSKIVLVWLFLICWLLAARRDKSIQTYVKEAVFFAVTGAAALLLYLLSNRLKYGEWMHFGYQGQSVLSPTFDHPVWSGAFGLILSPGKGLVWYCPLVILALAGWGRLKQRDPLLAWCLAIGFVLHLGIHGAWASWPGDWSWGPRYLIPVIPFALIPALLQFRTLVEKGWSRVSCLAAIGLLGSTLGVQVLSTAIHYMPYMAIVSAATNRTFPGLDQRKPVTCDDELLIHYVPELSPLRGHLWMLRLAWKHRSPNQRHPPWRSLGYAPWTIREETPPPTINWWPAHLDNGPGNRALIISFIALYLAGLSLIWLLPFPWNRDDSPSAAYR